MYKLTVSILLCSLALATLETGGADGAGAGEAPMHAPGMGAPAQRSVRWSTHTCMSKISAVVCVLTFSY